MLKPRLTWILGALVSLSLIAAPSANAAKGRIVAAKRYQATQITNRDVMLLPVHVSQARMPRHTIAVTIDEGRQFLLPDGDGQRQFLLPDGDGQRQFLLPDGDGQRQFVLPDADGQRQFLLPDGDGQRQFVLPDGDGSRQFVLPDGDGSRQFLVPDADGQ